MKQLQKLWDQFRMVILFFRLVKNPKRTDLIFRGVEIVSKDPDQPTIKEIQKRVLQNSIFKSMYQSSYVPDSPSLDVLKSLQADSFGYAVYQHMQTNGLNFELFPRLDPEKFMNYTSTRIYQDHDLWHVLLGYGVTIEDELALQAFGVAQFHSPIGTLLIAGGLLHLLAKNPTQAVQAFQKIVDGYNRGRKATFLLSQRLHDLFSLPLIEVQQRCGIV